MSQTTELAPKYDPSSIERDVYQRWLDAGVFRAAGDPVRESYVIVIPPPNVTSVLHMGHGLNNTIQDVLIRFQRMRGRDTLWLPGTDHAGIATQNVVERALATEGKRRQDLGREAFVERVWEHVHRTGGTILDQLKAIGSSCDWDRTRFTLDDAYSTAVRRVFVQLYEEGLIYRGHRVIHWCPRCLTSLSDEEAEFRERDDHLYYIRYPYLSDGNGGNDGSDGQRSGVVVATTRPETMFGDVCLVTHPEDDRFAHLKGRMVTIPLSGLAIPIELSTVVEREFGTGMLKVTPAHDANDFDIAASLPAEYDTPDTMTPDAHMAAVARVPAALQGLDRDEARKRIIEMLEAEGLLEKIEPYRHSVRHCYRCHTIVEPRLSDQWFVKMRPLAEPALEAYRSGTLTFVPERWGKVYENWLTEIRDWNISRQLWWGHRIPAWYCTACDHVTVAMDDPTECAACGGAVERDPDVLDTWFSSWLWPFATMGWPEETEDLARFYPGHTLVTGPDIIFFWVARMVMAGYHFMGDRPFDTVYLNGIVRDPQHRAFSKSLGNGIDPLDVVERYGADALRFTIVAGAAAGTDVIMDRGDMDSTFAAGRNFANKLWNVGRLILSNLQSAPPALADVDPKALTLADRWILSRCHRTVDEVTTALERMRLNDAANLAYHFLWDEVADWYLEQVKPRLYEPDRDGHAVAGSILVHVFGTALQLLHPVMPFITEVLWGHLPGERASLLAGSAWPTADTARLDDRVEEEFGLVQALVTAVRTIRAEYHVPPGATLRVVAAPAGSAASDAFAAERATILRLAKLDDLATDEPAEGVGGHAVLPDGTAVFVPLGDAIDVARECARLREELSRIDGQLKSVAGKLANAQFVERAPADVVAREREKEQSWREQRDTLAAKLHALGC